MRHGRVVKIIHRYTEAGLRSYVTIKEGNLLIEFVYNGELDRNLVGLEVAFQANLGSITRLDVEYGE